MKRPFKSITRKMIFIFCIFLSILMIGIALMNVMFFRNFKIWQNERQMIQQGKIISDYFKDIKINADSVKDYQEDISKAVETYNLTIRIVNKNYDVILGATSYHSQKKLRLPDETVRLLKKNKREINKREYYVINSYHEESSIPHIMYTRRLNSKYMLIISRTVKSIDEDIQTSNLFLLISGSIVAIFGLFVVRRFSKGFTEPILKINEAAQKIATLDFSTKIEIASKDEVGELAVSMNNISDKLSESIEQLQNDLTKRKQLVRDLSHELKTPITAIKGYTEALKFNVVKSENQKEHYYNTIVQECDRMNSLIQEMIELSKMDVLEDTLNLEVFDLTQVIQTIAEQFEQELNSKKISVDLGVKESKVYGDSHILARAIRNLVENAIRHVNVAGTIRLTGERAQNTYTLSVFNTGSHIPEEALNSVWDVFYKVDESRKREQNTYGIGLTIVKSSIELHHGTVQALNHEDGVEFRFTIPQENENGKKELKDASL